MQFLDEIGSGDFDRIRRAIYTLSALTIFLSNVPLTGNEVDIFGLKFLLQQETIIDLLSLFLWISLFIFAARMSEGIPKILAILMEKRDVDWWNPIEEQIQQYNLNPNEGYDYEADQFYRENPDWDEEAHAEKQEREARRNRVFDYSKKLSSINGFFGRVLMPISVAVIALFFPEALFLLVE